MLTFEEGRLADLCRKHGSPRLRVFGSAPGGEERPESEIDIVAGHRFPVLHLHRRYDRSHSARLMDVCCAAQKS